MRRCLLVVLRSLSPFHVDWDPPLTRDFEPDPQPLLGVIAPHPLTRRKH